MTTRETAQGALEDFNTGAKQVATGEPMTLRRATSLYLDGLKRSSDKAAENCPRCGWQAFQDVTMRKQLAQVNPQYFQPELPVRLAYIAAYLGLGAFLVWAYFFTASLTGFLVGLGL